MLKFRALSEREKSGLDVSIDANSFDMFVLCISFKCNAHTER